MPYTNALILIKRSPVSFNAAEQYAVARHLLVADVRYKRGRWQFDFKTTRCLHCRFLAKWFRQYCKIHWYYKMAKIGNSIGLHGYKSAFTFCVY